jgi:hypothetical protein
VTSFLLANGLEIPASVSNGTTVRLIDINLEIHRYLGLPHDPLTDSHGLDWSYVPARSLNGSAVPKN